MLLSSAGTEIYCKKTIEVAKNISQTTSKITTREVEVEAIDVENLICENKIVNINSYKLVKIPFGDLHKLRELYECKNCYTYKNSNDVVNCNYSYCSCCCNSWPPENQIAYQTITNYMKRLNIDFVTATEAICPKAATAVSNGNNNDSKTESKNLVNFDSNEIEVQLNGENYWLNNQHNYTIIEGVGGVFNGDREYSFEIYSFNGDWKNDGLFLIIDNHQIIFNALDGYFNTNKRILNALNLLQFEKGSLNILNGFSNRFLTIVNEYMIMNCYKINHDMNVTTLWYYLSKSEAKKFQIKIPDNLQFQQLSEDHAEIINHYWSWKHQGSKELIKRLIKYNENVGIFDSNGNLIAWCLRQQVGALGVLYVMDSYRNQGIGGLIVKKLSIILAEQNQEDICATVLENNTASRRLFESLGFKVVEKTNWIVIEN